MLQLSPCPFEDHKHTKAMDTTIEIMAEHPIVKIFGLCRRMLYYENVGGILHDGNHVGGIGRGFPHDRGRVLPEASSMIDTTKEGLDRGIHTTTFRFVRVVCNG